jgi:hypothetical protein
MPFETTITVPTQHLRDFTLRLADAGFLVLDRGERATTDDGWDAEAVLHVLHLR